MSQQPKLQLAHSNGGIVVSIAAFQAVDLGSNHSWGVLFFLFFFEYMPRSGWKHTTKLLLTTMFLGFLPPLTNIDITVDHLVQRTAEYANICNLSRDKNPVWHI